MRLRAKSYSDLLGMLASGLIRPEEWRQAVLSRPCAPAPVERLPLRDYGELCDAKDDAEALAIWRRVNRQQPPKLSDPASEVMDDIAAVAKGLQLVNDAFAKIRTPPLSSEERQAGFGRRNFGLFGLVDRLARRQGLTDEEARNMTVSDAIGKLAIDADAATCQRNYMEICRRNSKTRR